MSDLGDNFSDSIAFARCVLRDDIEGIKALLELNDNIVDLMVAQSWILGSAVFKLAEHLELSMDEVWAVLLEAVLLVDKEIEERPDEDG